MRIRSLILGIIAAACLIAGITLAVTPANADPGSPTCVTRAEYRQVHKGMTKAAVTREFGIRGHRDAGATSGGYRTEIWSYKTCNRFSAVAISFSSSGGAPLRLDYKSAVWSY